MVFEADIRPLREDFWESFSWGREWGVRTGVRGRLKGRDWLINSPHNHHNHCTRDHCSCPRSPPSGHVGSVAPRARWSCGTDRAVYCWLERLWNWEGLRLEEKTKNRTQNSLSVNIIKDLSIGLRSYQLSNCPWNLRFVGCCNLKEFRFRLRFKNVGRAIVRIHINVPEEE